MLKPSNWKSRRSVRRSVNDKVCDEVWDEVWDDTRKGRAVHQPPRIVKSRTRTKKPRKGRTFPQPSVSRGQSARPYLLLLSMPRHTSSLSLSHALSSTLRRKTLSRLLSPSPISTQKRLSCPCYTRYPDSQPIPITSRPIQFSPHKPRSASGVGAAGRPVPNGAKLSDASDHNRNRNPFSTRRLRSRLGLRLRLRWP
jgi:hypothetical protein